MFTTNTPANLPDFAKFKRDENGLQPGVTYVYNADGSVNWRAMIKPEHLVINTKGKDRSGKSNVVAIEEQFGKPIEQIDITQIDDKYLMILLGGIKDLARMRGILSCVPKVDISTETIATVTCVIEFEGNYETNGKPVTFGDVGSATLENTAGFGRLYLAAIATNRAFVRCVRNFLGIGIVGQDEIKAGDTGEVDAPAIPSYKLGEQLATMAAEKKLSFEDIKKGAISKYRSEMESDPEKWTAFKDVPGADVWTLMGKLNKKTV